MCLTVEHCNFEVHIARIAYYCKEKKCSIYGTMESPCKRICSIYGTMESPHQTFSPPYSWRIEPELRPRSKILVFQLSIANAMSRNRFQEIKKYFHCADNKISYLVTRWVKLFLFMKKSTKTWLDLAFTTKSLALTSLWSHFTVAIVLKCLSQASLFGLGIRLGHCRNVGYPYHLKIYQGKEANSENSPLGTRVKNPR